jgi:hypothetical protein
MGQLSETVRDDLRRVLLSPDQAISLEVHGSTDAAVLVPLFLRAASCT